LVTPATATSQDATTYTWTLPGAAIAADTLTVNTTTVDLTGPPPAAIAAKAIYSPVMNTVGPVINTSLLASAASAATPTTQGLMDFSGATGVGEGANLTHISAKPGTAADGAFGNAFVIYTAGPIAGQAGVTVTTSTTTAGLLAGQTAVIIAYPGGVYGTGQQLAAALNGNAVFNTILTANSTDTATPVGASGVVGSAPVLATGVVGTSTLAGGQAFYAVTAILSKQVVPNAALTTNANWTVGAGATAAATAAVTLDNNATPQAVTVVVLATSYVKVPAHGTTTLTWAGGTVDFAGNAFSGATVTIP
jgi:hypothetical protein